MLWHSDRHRISHKRPSTRCSKVHGVTNSEARRLVGTRSTAVRRHDHGRAAQFFPKELRVAHDGLEECVVLVVLLIPAAEVVAEAASIRKTTGTHLMRARALGAGVSLARKPCAVRRVKLVE